MLSLTLRLLHNFKILSAIAVGMLLVVSCTPKNEPRWEHQPAQSYKKTSTPDKDDVTEESFTATDVRTLHATLKDGKGDLTEKVLKPLAKIVLNKRFIESPVYRGVKLSQMISAFNEAFVKEYGKSPRSAAFTKVKEEYYDTVFAGCSADLRSGCLNASLFSGDGRHTQIMTLLARELDAEIENQLKNSPSAGECIAKNEQCRNLIEERYRRLSMGVYKSTKYQDPQFSFAYLKYARVFSYYLDYTKDQPLETTSMAYSYLAEVHGKIFETIIAKYQPEDQSDPEYRSFVENFNPWTFSRKHANVFQHGTAKMFALGAECCLYTDSKKNQLSKTVRDAINQSQGDRDTFGPAFRKIVEAIEKEHGDRLFRNLHMGGLLATVKNADSSFYDEYFFVIDRLFRGHLSTGEVEMVLRNTNLERTKVEFPKRLSDYIKINIIYLIMETNRYLASVYSSDIASDSIFEEAVKRSRDISGKWLELQAQVDLLDKLMNAYFKDRLTSSKEYVDAYNFVRSINRNIHYLSVFPNMIVMNYFLTKSKGAIKFVAWWGGEISVDADTILKNFIDADGSIDSWFRFGKDTEGIDRLTLLYSLEYLLSTESLKSFVDKESGTKEAEGRTKFFEQLFTLYINDDIQRLGVSIREYEQQTLGHSTFGMTKDLCEYEIKGGTPQYQSIPITSLSDYNYSGLGDKGANSVLINFMRTGFARAKDLLGSIDRRRSNLQAWMAVIEGDLLRQGKIAKVGDPHPDLEKARGMLKELDGYQGQLTKLFINNHKFLFDCAMRMREVERRRANRLYDEERIFLGKVFDRVKELADIKDLGKREARAEQITADYFRKELKSRFDKVDGTSFRMAKYDLLMRIKTRIESDIFTKKPESPEEKAIAAKEVAAYGKTRDEYLRPRRVTIEVPLGFERNDTVEQSISAGVSINGTTAQDREEFIRQGLATLNGSPKAFIQWQGQAQSDRSEFDYINTLEAFYLLPKMAESENLEVTAADLTDAYIRTVGNLGLDGYDVEYLTLFQWQGRHRKSPENSEEDVSKYLFEKDGMSRLPFFYYLMNHISNLATISLQPKNGNERGPVSDALDIAKKINSLQAFVFPPSETVKTAVIQIYGDRANHRLGKVAELYRHLIERAERVTDAGALDPRLKLPVFVEGNTLQYWYQEGTKNLIDNQKVQDLRYQISDFSQFSGKLYKTQEKVKAP